MTVINPSAPAGRVRQPGLFGGLMPITTRNLFGDFTQSGNLSDGVQTSLTTRMAFTPVVAAGDIRLVYGNFTGPTDGVNAINIKATIESPAATFHTVTFGGLKTAILDAGGYLVSDPIPIDVVALTNFWVRTFVSVGSAGQKWPLGQLFASAYGDGTNVSEGAAASDKTSTGTITAANVWSFGPYAVIGNVTDANKVPSVLIVGDSIADGTGDTSGLQERGFIPRALNQTRPWVKVSAAGEGAQQWATMATRKQRMAAAAGCSSAICEYGINDLGSRTLAQIKTDLITCWNVIAARGVAVWQTTITPKTTSSDSWATTANQTPFSGDSDRVLLNNWLRDGSPMLAGAAAATGSSANGTLRAGMAGHPLAGYFEVADTVESARDSGKWKVDGTANKYTSDGTHPTAFGHTAAAAGIVVASLL